MDELREEIKGIVARHCDEPNHREAVLRALARPGFALHPEADCRAGVLTYHVYQAIRNSPGFVATQVAAAVELQLEASFMLDHVADRELDPQQSPNSAEELALAITRSDLWVRCGLRSGSPEWVGPFPLVRTAGISQKRDQRVRGPVPGRLYGEADVGHDGRSPSDDGAEGWEPWQVGGRLWCKGGHT